jgi:hypothetical protein
MQAAHVTFWVLLDWMVRMYASDPSVPAGVFILHILVRLLWYAPILMLFCMIFYACAALAYLASHPELLVSSVLDLIDFGPSYMQYVGSRMLNQTMAEFGKRMR